MARPPVAGPIVIPSTAELKVVWSDGAREFTNVLHATYATPPTFGEALAQTVFAAISSAFTSSGWLAMVHATVDLERLELKDLNSASNPAYLSSGAPVSGTGATSALPSSTSVEVSLRTGKAGRQWVGRTYLGGLDGVVQADARTFTAGAGVAAAAFLEAIRTALPGTGFNMALAQRALQAGTDSHGAALPPRAAHAEPVTSARITDHRLDTQRRRLGR